MDAQNRRRSRVVSNRIRLFVLSRRCACRCLVVGGLLLAAPAAPGEAQPQAGAASTAAPVWFQVFLRDGGVLSVLGEFTRVGDDVIVQTPTGTIVGNDPPATRAVTIAASDVDWERTEAYRGAVRRAQFAAAGGARAYAAFTEDVAATLRHVAALADPLERISRLETARARLAEWPALHHGYRAADVAETLSVIDDVLHGMRAAAGQQAFALAITSSTTPPPPRADTLVPPPTLQEVVAQAMGLARRLSDPGERLALLQAASSLLESADVDAGWARAARTDVRRALRQEQRTTSAYERLRTWMLERTARFLAAADVRGLMGLRRDVMERDAALRQQRPADVAALLATLDVHLETARRHRLLLARWHERRPVLERYAAVLESHVGPRMPLTHALEEIKALAGPGADLLARAEGQLAASRADADLVAVPEEAQALQQLWAGAQQLAARAFQARRAAIRSGDMREAWAASAAAAGALLLRDRIRAESAALVRPPALPVSGS